MILGRLKLRRRRQRGLRGGVIIRGDSMSPSLVDGSSFDVVPIEGEPLIGMVVIVVAKAEWFPCKDHRRIDYIIKRVAALSPVMVRFIFVSFYRFSRTCYIYVLPCSFYSRETTLSFFWAIMRL